MQLTNNTILITGGGSGIGLALAEEFKRLGNTVIVAGRSQEKLAHAREKGLHTLAVDLNDVSAIAAFASKAISDFPTLNIVIHNAGVMVNEKLTVRNNSQTAIDTIATNVLAPIVLTNALLPHLIKQPSATVMTVTSGLAFVPLAMTPTYSASKAAIHSYTEALRFQLAETNVEVKELIPPYTRTSLMGSRQAADQNAMPLDEYVNEVIALLKEDPSRKEIGVKRVQPQRTAAFEGAQKYDEFFKRQNDNLMLARKAEWDQL